MRRKRFFMRDGGVFLLLLLGLVLSGCAGTSLRSQAVARYHEIGRQNRNRIQSLQPGMSRQRVRHIMGTEDIPVSVGTVQWYETQVHQPFRVRRIKSADKNYLMYYYWTRTSESEHDLTPVIFQDDKLVAVGWENDVIPRETLEKESWGTNRPPWKDTDQHR